MFINFSLSRLIIFASCIILLPFIQKQWFNLHLFNTNKYSFYYILFYLSGYICPILVCLNSLKKFTFYKFNTNEVTRRNIKIIKGKTLLFLVLLTLVSLSILLVNYFHINIDSLINILRIERLFNKINFVKSSYFIFLFCLLLTIRKCKVFIKKLILINFFFFASLIWHSHVNNILINGKFLINYNFDQENLNYINIFCLFAIELLFYLWSYISYKNNLSDWKLPIPKKGDLFTIFKIAVFYFSIVIYYSII